MNNIGKSVIKKVGEREVICRELTVSQVRGLVMSTGDADLISDYLFEEIRLRDLPTFTNLTAEEVDAMYPSDLVAVVQGCQEANPHFFGLLAREAKARASS